MNEPQSSEAAPGEVGRYARRRDAEERGLVAVAMGFGYRIERCDDGAFALLVAERNREAVLRELEKFEAENSQRKNSPTAPLEKIPTASLFVCGWVMAGFFLMQKIGPPWWNDAGVASSSAIIHDGAWWLALTALTLHADFSHIAANLASGLLFAAFVLPLLGTGWTWALIVASGAAGNLLNAWNHRAVEHFSIGASTAVFGALGILTAFQTLDAVRSTREVRFWQVILPLGAGLALLAFLGVGEEHDQTDLLAHFWGFSTGVLFGSMANFLQLKKRTPAFVQHLLAIAAPAALAGAWLLARPR
jgi:membrane associated rhomboid family serine protease